jgi:hypothetical protein
MGGATSDCEGIRHGTQLTTYETSSFFNLGLVPVPGEFVPLSELRSSPSNYAIHRNKIQPKNFGSCLV